MSRTFPTLGILGGGQLGLMLLQSAQALQVPVRIMDPDPQCPCAQVAPFVTGDIGDETAVARFAESVNVLTIEIERVSATGLEQAQARGVAVHPSGAALRTIQDKLEQKRLLERRGLATSRFFAAGELSAEELAQRLPLVQKSRREGYDGRGVRVLRGVADLADLLPGETYFEELVPIAAEFSVLVTRDAAGRTECFRPVEMVFDPASNQLDYLLDVPLDADLSAELVVLAKRVADAFEVVGNLAVEMFRSETGRLLVNEVAPRPHNSGHHTMKSYTVSQYDQHLRAVLGWPLAAPRALSDAALVNLVGDPGARGVPIFDGWEEVLAIEGVHPFLYGKKQVRPYRKMGHVTLLGTGRSELSKKVEAVRERLRVLGTEQHATT